MDEKIILTGEDGEKLELYILEETRIGGMDYILASDVESGDGNCYILKDNPTARIQRQSTRSWRTRRSLTI